MLACDMIQQNSWYDNVFICFFSHTLF